MQAKLPSPRHATMGSFFTQTHKNLPTARHKPEHNDKRCAYCKGPHPNHNCNVVKDCQERWSIAKLKCKGKHHTTLCPHLMKPPNLHPTPPLMIPATQNHNNLPTPSATSATQQPTQTHAILVSSMHSPTTRHVSLLKTAIATVSTGQLQCDANILLDEGAQRSFITTDLANQFQVQPSQTE